MKVPQSLSFALLFLFNSSAVSAASSESSTTIETISPTSVTVEFSYQPSSPTPTCDGDAASYCPACDNRSIQWGEFGSWAVYCGRQFTNATFYYDVEDEGVSRCIEVCMDTDLCYAPVITPDGKCLLADLERDEDGELDEGFVEREGWAILYPRFTGAVTSSGSGLEATPSSSFSPPPASTTAYSPQADGYNDTLSFCHRLDVACPRCDNAFVEDSSGEFYQVSCNSKWVNKGNRKVFDMDYQRCMLQCDNTANCQGFTYTFETKCSLALSGDASIQDTLPRNSHTAFILNPSNAPTAAPPGPSGFGNQCIAHAVSCPACSDSYVEDDLGNFYHVLCDNQIYSEKYYTADRDLTPAGCMAECDRFEWCRGAHFSAGRICKLGRGNNAFPQRKAGTTAFLPVDLSFTPAPPTLEPFPPGYDESSEVASSTIFSSPATPSPSDACAVNSVRCSQCERKTVLDGFDAGYEVTCRVQPVCNDFTATINDISQDSCMKHCDVERTCLAALWDDGDCTLCQGSYEELRMYTSPDTYVLFVKEPVGPEKPSPSSSRPMLSSRPSSTKQRTSSVRQISTTTATVTVTGTPSPIPEVGSVQCPKNGGDVAYDPSHGLYFEINCGTGFQAERKRFISVRNLSGCAKACTGKCDGFQLESRTRCGLFTAVTKTTSKPGATVGLRVEGPPRECHHRGRND